MRSRTQILNIPVKFFADVTVPRLSYHEPWETAGRRLEAYGGPVAFAVDDENKLVGIVSKSDVFRFLGQGVNRPAISPHTPVEKIMRRIPPDAGDLVISDTAPVQTAIDRLEGNNKHGTALDSIIVVDDERHPIGQITRESIARGLDELRSTESY